MSNRGGKSLRESRLRGLSKWTLRHRRPGGYRDHWNGCSRAAPRSHWSASAREADSTLFYAGDLTRAIDRVTS
jgi:hypothetical protein